MQLMKGPIVAVGGLLLVLSGSARAGTVTLGASDDTMVNSRFPNNNFGTGISMFTGTDSGSGGASIGQMRSLIRFAMPASLQNKVSVTHVSLGVVLYAPGNAPTTAGTAVIAATISLQPIAQSWIEGSASLSATGNGSGIVSGAPVVGVACSNGATWNAAACGATNWTTAGVAVSGTSATASTAGKSSGSTLVWDSGSNAGLIGIVQGWIDAPSTNFGWRLQSSSEGAIAGQLQRFATRQSGNPPSLQIDYTTCTTAANAACVTSQTNNSCNDPGGFSSTYSCTCNHRDANNNLAYTGTGTTQCVDLDDCIGNPCDDNGDSTATCTDAVAPSGGHSCTCTTGFVFNGTTCVAGCNNANPTPLPCGHGGTCNTPDGGNSWSCSGCDAGYVSNGAARAACVDFNACDATAKTSCNDSQMGNSCVDDAAPALTYHCVCTNPGYVVGTVGGKSACVPVVCGDGVANGSEQCDSGAANGTPGSCCSASCTFVAATTQCRAPTGPCGLGASCSGSAAACPAETFKPATTTCAAAAACLQASTCSGSASACPAQASVADGSACSGGSGVCVAGACVPLDMSQPLDLTAADDLASASGDDLAAAGGADLATGGPHGGCGCVVGGAGAPSQGPIALLVALALLVAVRRISGRGAGAGRR